MLGEKLWTRLLPPTHYYIAAGEQKIIEEGSTVDTITGIKWPSPHVKKLQDLVFSVKLCPCQFKKPQV